MARSKKDRAVRPGKRTILSTCVSLALMLGGCAYPIRNVPAQKIDSSGYRWPNLKGGVLDDTLVIVAASGGGTRAATLELSVLKGLKDIKLKRGGRLSDEVDIISSVSGGSVTAAYFALHGSDRIDELETKFLRQDGIGALLASGLNPVGLSRISTPAVERIDLLIEYFEKTLFTNHESFGSLLQTGRRPYLILNAADMVEGIPFPLTQTNFDLLCSDLSALPLAVGVAASAAFPVALSAVTLKNHSPCPAQPRSWPPLWVRADAATDWYDNPERAMRGRAGLAYALGKGGQYSKDYVHLLDGGIADNLGLGEPLRILTTTSPSPAFLDDLEAGTIKKIVFIVVNARAFETSTLNREQATPGILPMLLSTISSGIDRTAAGNAARLMEVLSNQLSAKASERRANFPDMAANLDELQKHIYLLNVDFDAIGEETCRRKFHNIKTSWTNSDREIDGLLKIGRALLRQDPQFPRMLADIDAQSSDKTTVAEACAMLDAQRN
ncbi:MAG TPA: patatin-like phospholipase family protein [Rhizomicrobium sp.]|nr:patatin-like phospholipase family protein [Rhizomicrobium sp.]